MRWTRSQTLALAAQKCAHCRGVGLRLFGRRGILTPCDCVLRSVFRICYIRFRELTVKEKYQSKVNFEVQSGPNRRGTWGRKNEEYLADFIAVAHRALDEEEYRVFRYRFLLGADWNLCCRRLGVDRGSFFHTVYRVQCKLGHAFSETLPYALFPLDEYFEGTPREQLAKPFPRRKLDPTPVRPPVVEYVNYEQELKIA